MFDPTDNIQEEKYWKIIDKKMFFKVLQINQLIEL